jgi:hypothetical protein
MNRCDPSRTQEPFNRLYDVAHTRGFRVGLRAGKQLRKGAQHNVEWRDIVAIECKTPGKILVEPLGPGGLHGAAHGLLARLPETIA